MKKIVFSIILITIIILVVIVVGINGNRAKEKEIAEFNLQFEKFKGKTMYGADVLTIINSARENNTNYNIARNEQGLFLENDENSIKIEIILLSKNKEGEIEERIYPMETLEKAGLTTFISSFGLTNFECSNIEYNKQKRVSKVTVKQLEI